MYDLSCKVASIKEVSQAARALCMREYTAAGPRPMWKKKEGRWINYRGHSFAITDWHPRTIFRTSVGYRRGEGFQYMYLGYAYSILEQIEKAKNFYKHALAIGKEVKDPKIIDYCEDQLKSLNP